MWVKLHYKTKNGKRYATKNDITVKNAIKLYERDLKNDSNVIEVYLTHFGEWYRNRYKTLKEKK